jgi:hypothetical protein
MLEVIILKGKSFDNKEKKFNKMTISRDIYCRVFWALCCTENLKMFQLLGGCLFRDQNNSKKLDSFVF